MSTLLGQVGSLFTAPWLAAAGAAAVSVPIAIHLLSRYRRQREAWGAMRFLMQAYRRHKRRLHFEQWLLLAVRCLLMLLLGLALAGPLMGGFVGQMAGDLDQRGRVVHLLVNDSLTTRTTASTGEARQRFEAQRDKALDIVDALKPNDRLSLWRTARPAEAMVASPTRQHQQVREQIEQMQPRFSRPDLPRALTGAGKQLEQGGVSPDRGRVFVLSDFSRSADYLAKIPTQAARQVADHAELRITEPATAAANRQVRELRPRRPLVLAPPGEPATVPTVARFRRFGSTADAARSEVTVTLRNLAGDVLATGQSLINWRQGQAETSVNLTLSPSQPSPAGEGGRTWLLEATLAGDGPANRLPADDAAWASVQMRSYLNVGLIGSGPSAADGERLPPEQWLRLALSPQGPASASALRSRQIEPGLIGGSDQPLSELDAAMVVRPDQLNEAGWQALADFANQGGLVWVLTPAAPGGNAWVEPLRQTFDLDWQIAMEPTAAPENQPRGLNGDLATPEPLTRLAADWQGLLRPLLVQRWLAIEAPDSQTWLALETADQAGNNGQQPLANAGNDPEPPAEAGGDEPNQPNAASGSALLASREVGSGQLLVLGTALAANWTNLPTKPVMVPLVQETLRGTVGPQRQTIVAGDRPTLSGRWTGVGEVRGLAWSAASPGANGEGNAGANNREGQRANTVPTQRFPLTAVEAGPRPAEPFRLPGVYRAADAGLALSVNADPAAGDTRATPRQRLSEWFDQLAGADRWRFLPETSPGSVLATTTARASLGWPLLWGVLALAIAELLLARHFAHAQRMDSLPARQRVINLWRRLSYRG